MPQRCTSLRLKDERDEVAEATLDTIQALSTFAMCLIKSTTRH
eukprot:CAMPEP_0115498718 /NCGR_PEP_ID=MMETSP0271-20121206/66946_1 /TAXON_ID=71861 /ORGANISM="Scrippsiella trochoidea, Strain CCMP3099" /LENGTH=42 /DNA_ID= /DNA_START= /DNA_END= /DNA_ORIENTATION=